MLELLGNLSSIVGLGITVWVLLKVRKIQRGYLLRARLPALGRRLGRHRSNLASLLDEYPSSAREVQAELKKCRATLRSLRRMVGRALGVELNRIERRIAHICGLSEAATANQIWELYGDLGGLEEDVRNLVEDVEWR